MLLWIPVHRESPEESDELIQKVTVANGAVLDFCDGFLAFSEMIEIVDDCGAQTDRYLADLDESIRFLGA
jgi:hypothetical protein